MELGEFLALSSPFLFSLFFGGQVLEQGVGWGCGSSKFGWWLLTNDGETVIKPFFVRPIDERSPGWR
jgi:hypothetical protein